MSVQLRPNRRMSYSGLTASRHMESRSSFFLPLPILKLSSALRASYLKEEDEEGVQREYRGWNVQVKVPYAVLSTWKGCMMLDFDPGVGHSCSTCSAFSGI